MTHEEVQRWLDGYISAWRSGDAGEIGALFSEDAVYSFKPWLDEKTVEGREAIVAAWLQDPDEPGSWEASYQPFAVDGDRAVATGWSRYLATDDQPERMYHNAYLLQFDQDGHCVELREFFMLQGK
jgi:ketosteroid isomerase-like protein